MTKPDRTHHSVFNDLKKKRFTAIVNSFKMWVYLSSYHQEYIDHFKEFNQILNR